MTGWFIGRFQPWHEGHAKCVEKILEECDRCTVIVKCAEMSDSDPYTYDDVISIIKAWILKSRNKDKVDVQVIYGDSKDLTVYYGRKVGWKFKEIKLDKKTEAISATKIRECTT